VRLGAKVAQWFVSGGVFYSNVSLRDADGAGSAWSHVTRGIGGHSLFCHARLEQTAQPWGMLVSCMMLNRFT